MLALQRWCVSESTHIRTNTTTHTPEQRIHTDVEKHRERAVYSDSHQHKIRIPHPQSTRRVSYRTHLYYVISNGPFSIRCVMLNKSRQSSCNNRVDVPFTATVFRYTVTRYTVDDDVQLVNKICRRSLYTLESSLKF